MLLQFVAAVMALAVAYFAYKVKTMRGVDRQSWIFWFMVKSGMFRLLCKLKIRPISVEITLSNGVTTIVPHPSFKHPLEEVLKFDVRRSDVFVATYPKAGTTWVQEIVRLILNNADTEGAKKQSISNRFGFLEAIDAGLEIGKGFQALEKWPLSEQRLIKTHLPHELLPEQVRSGKKCKIIYVARNPKDLCVSYYHFHRMNIGMPEPGSWNEFLTKFCSGKLGWGCWFAHNLTYWKKHQENPEQIYLVTYEDLKKNLRVELVSMARFLEKELSDRELDKIAEHCTFSSMSKTASTNYSDVQQYGLDFKISKFMRKGEVGDWKNHFTLNENAAFDDLYEEKMKESGMEFVFELDS